MKWIPLFIALAILLVMGWAVTYRELHVHPKPYPRLLAPAPSGPQISVDRTIVKCGKLEPSYDGSNKDNAIVLLNCIAPGRTTVIQNDGTVWETVDSVEVDTTQR